MHWTIAFRKSHKKGIAVEATKKKTKKTVKAQRGIVGLSIDQILAKRNQKPEEREALRQKAIGEAKLRKQEAAKKKKSDIPKV